MTGEESYFIYNGYVRGFEYPLGYLSDDPDRNSCNSNNTYTFLVEDDRADGYAVEVLFETSAGWKVYGEAPNDGSTFTFKDGYGAQSSARQIFRWYKVSDPSVDRYAWEDYVGECICGNYGWNHGF